MAARLTARRTASPSMMALILLTGLGTFATDTYLSGLPALQRSLHTSATTAQLTITAYIVGVAAGQLLLGPLSDAWGRRRMLITGAALFMVLSVACAAAPNAAVLVAARLGQGLAIGGGIAIARATVTDTRSGPAAAATFGTLAYVSFLGPIIAPAIGGLVLVHSTWRFVFLGLALAGAVMTVAVVAGVPETLPSHRRQSGGLAAAGYRMGGLLRDWGFMQHVAVYSLTAGGFFTYIGGSSFVLQTTLQITPGLYTVVFTVNAAAMAAAGVAFRVLVGRTGPRRLRTLGVATSTTAAATLLAVALTARSEVPLAAPWVLLCLLVAGTGFTVPATTALAQEAGRRSPGTAAALQGGIGFLAGALVTPLTGSLGYHSLVPMAALMTGFYVAGATILALTTKATRRAEARRSTGQHT